MKLSELKTKLNPLAEITGNREKMDIKDLYGTDVTLDDFMIATDEEGKEYAVATCKEYPAYFHFGGSMETTILKMISEDAECLAEFREKGLRVHYEQGKTKKGQTFTLVTILD